MVRIRQFRQESVCAPALAACRAGGEEGLRAEFVPFVRDRIVRRVESQSAEAAGNGVSPKVAFFRSRRRRRIGLYRGIFRSGAGGHQGSRTMADTTMARPRSFRLRSVRRLRRPQSRKLASRSCSPSASRIYLARCRQELRRRRLAHPERSGRLSDRRSADRGVGAVPDSRCGRFAAQRRHRRDEGPQPCHPRAAKHGQIPNHCQHRGQCFSRGQDHSLRRREASRTRCRQETAGARGTRRVLPRASLGQGVAESGARKSPEQAQNCAGRRARAAKRVLAREPKGNREVPRSSS